MGKLTLQGHSRHEAKKTLDKKNQSIMVSTRVVAAAHFHVGVVDTEHPSSRVTYVGGPLHVCHIGCTRTRDVEVAFAVASIETCLGREQRAGRRHRQTAGLESRSANPCLQHSEVNSVQSCNPTCAATPPSPARFPPLVECIPVVQVMLL